MHKLTVDGRGTVGQTEVPIPDLAPHGVLVKTAFSLISPGTETRGILRRRKDPGDEASAHHPGYASAGVVQAAGSEMSELRPGDRVGVYGSPFFYGGHAEYSAPTRHYAVKLPENVSLEEGAFAALGAITLHGFRQARLQLGETVSVIGLGLLGQLICQFARAAGVRVFASDLIPERVELARSLGCEHAVCAPGESLTDLVTKQTHGIGTDAVIIAASGRSDEPVKEAMQLVRDKGRVVVVGGVPCTAERHGPFFSKEPDFVCSRAGGAGRYDPVYERDGIDYPMAFVRWTVGRNLSCFIDLVADGQVKVKPLVTDVFPFNEAPSAYEKILSDKATTMGVLLRYD